MKALGIIVLDSDDIYYCLMLYCFISFKMQQDFGSLMFVIKRQPAFDYCLNLAWVTKILYLKSFICYNYAIANLIRKTTTGRFANFTFFVIVLQISFVKYLSVATSVHFFWKETSKSEVKLPQEINILSGMNLAGLEVKTDKCGLLIKAILSLNILSANPSPHLKDDMKGTRKS